MNSIILLNSELVEKNVFEIKDVERLSHLRNIIKVSIDDSLKVTLINKGIAKALVKKIDDHLIQLEITSEFIHHKTPDIRLVVGVSRPQTSKKIIEHATSLGIKSIDFFKAELSEKSYLTSKVFTEDNQLEKLTMLGLSQSAKYCMPPIIKTHLRKEAIVENLNKGEQKLILSLNSKQTIIKNPLDLKKPIHLVIGPERGFTKNEEDYFINQGFRPVLISNSTLRVEIACFSALSQLELLRMENQND